MACGNSKHPMPPDAGSMWRSGLAILAHLHFCGHDCAACMCVGRLQHMRSEWPHSSLPKTRFGQPTAGNQGTHPDGHFPVSHVSFGFDMRKLWRFEVRGHFGALCERLCRSSGRPTAHAEQLCARCTCSAVSICVG